MATYVVCDQHGRLQGWRRVCPHCPPPPPAITPEQRAAIVERIRGGEVARQVSPDYGVTFQRIHQIVNELDPEAFAVGANVRQTRRRERQEAARQARIAALGPCRVCLGPIRRLMGGRTATITCSSRCAELWAVARYHLDREQYETHRRVVARNALARPDHYGPAKVAWATRYLAEGGAPNRRFIQPGSRVAKALKQIEELRRERSASEAVAG